MLNVADHNVTIATFVSCAMIMNERVQLELVSRILPILSRIESSVQRIFKDAVGVSSAFLKQP